MAFWKLTWLKTWHWRCWVISTPALIFLQPWIPLPLALKLKCASKQHHQAEFWICDTFLLRPNARPYFICLMAAVCSCSRGSHLQVWDINIIHHRWFFTQSDWHALSYFCHRNYKWHDRCRSNSLWARTEYYTCPVWYFEESIYISPTRVSCW